MLFTSSRNVFRTVASAASTRDGSGWEHFSAAVASGRGVLLVTPHLGNWEFGGPLLARKGVRPLVLTAAEPGAGFTELRRDSRGRHGIETLVVGRDPFAFVDMQKAVERIHRALRSGKPILVVANKVDGPRHEGAVAELYSLGAQEVFGISAAHGRGLPELLDALVNRLRKDGAAGDLGHVIKNAVIALHGETS